MAEQASAEPQAPDAPEPKRPGDPEGPVSPCGCPPGECRCGVLTALQRVPWAQFCLAQTASGTRFVASSMHDIPSPDTVATMVEALQLRDDSRVLQGGTGTGYTAAVLAEVAHTGEVYTVERQSQLVEFARSRFDALGYERVRTRQGDALEGWKVAAPFDAILVSFPLTKEPTELLDQLFLGGRLVAPPAAAATSTRWSATCGGARTTTSAKSWATSA